MISHEKDHHTKTEIIKEMVPVKFCVEGREYILAELVDSGSQVSLVRETLVKDLYKNKASITRSTNVQIIWSKHCKASGVKEIIVGILS